MPKRIPMEGKRYNRLVVIGVSEERGSQNIRKWLCRCDCGNLVSVSRQALITGNNKSCGCLGREYQEKRKVCFETDDKRLYHIWKNMISRCCNSDNPSYKIYGGRGITVCEEWKTSFDNFKTWAKSNGYDGKLTLDRINTNGNYESNNCRWADYITQMNNRRSNIRITINGETHTLAEWGRIKGISEKTIWARLFEAGWSEYDAIMKPLRGRK